MKMVCNKLYVLSNFIVYIYNYANPQCSNITNNRREICCLTMKDAYE